VALRDATARLEEFLDWMLELGLDEAELPDYQRLGAALFELAAGSRVTERHILRLLDAQADAPDGDRTAQLVQDVGEQILRFQKIRPFTTPQPVVAVPDSPSRPSRGSAPHAFVPRPEERVAGELRPPVASARVTPPRFVSFATGSTPPPEEAPGTRPLVRTPAPSPSSPSVQPSTRSSARLFRCRVCGTMVQATAEGNCTQCGTPAPRVSSAPVATVPVARPTTPPWLLPAAILVALLIGAAILAPPLLERLHHPSDPVTGEVRSTHLGGTRFVFPQGWRHARDADAAPTAGLAGLSDVFGDPVSLRSSRYFLGATGEPAAELLVTIGARASGSSETGFAAWSAAAVAAPASLDAPLRSLLGVANLRVLRCAAGPPVPHGAARCSTMSGNSPGYVYLWQGHAQAGAILYIGSGSPEAALSESTALVAGIDLG
jgi:hypothetical protein